MTALDATADESAQPGAHPEEVAAAPAAAVGPVAGDPAILGLPTFIAGSVALGLELVGVVPAGTAGAALPIILATTAAGLFLAAIWAGALGQSAVASIFGIFGGFWLSYAVLVLGLTHNWFGITASAATGTQELFLTTWLIVIVMLTLATLRLPSAFTAVFALVDLALLLLLLATANASAGLVKTAGYVVLVFAALGVYLFFNAASLATGGKALPLGRPVMRA
jgi:succinate-acetate transporter protein